MNVNRQLTDIQVQADRILSNRSSLEEIEDFHRYNEEFKNYLRNNITSETILQKINQIPIVIDETKSNTIQIGIFQIIVSFMISPFSTYIHQKQTIENAKTNIQDIRGKYSTLEFLIKSV